MSFNASRLTLYALISGIEDDLRGFLLPHLQGTKNASEVLGDVYGRACERLAKELGEPHATASLPELVPYIDFSDAYKCLNANAANLPQKFGHYIRSITPMMDQITTIRNRVMHGRPLNYDDLAKTLEFSEKLVATTETRWATVESTLYRLKADPSFVLGLDIPSSDDPSDRRHNLPTPDFDETGFLGRRKQVDDLLRLCLGPYPVITVTAEGGIGKTALALKVAYEILDRPDCPFDAVVWTTAKVNQLTPQEIIAIRGAISTSLGVFENIAQHLAGIKAEDPINEVLSYLEQFKIFLIIDNLETVMDNRSRSFLERMPLGSKILMTSRIGLGAFEFPYKLVAMDGDDAVQLLRAVAQVRGLNDVLKMSNKKLKEYCLKMKMNPGWIKWFVSTVQAGKRPEEVLDKPQVFLDYCMSNVYEYLTQESRHVLRCIRPVNPSSSIEVPA